MQIKLKLSKGEWMALLDVARAIGALARDTEDFEEFQAWDSMRVLAMEMVGRLPELKDQNSLTLKGDAALMIWTMADPMELPEYEGAVLMSIHGEIDRQWQSRKAQLQGNLKMGYELDGGGR